MDMEQEIKAAGADKAPRITPADIEANIASVWYFTAAEGCAGALMARPVEVQPPLPAEHPLQLLTFCVLVLKNGFTVTGESACASPENFNAEIGRRIARENAVSKLWPLLGFQLRTDLHGCAYSASGQSAPVKKTATLLSTEPSDFRDRVRSEVAELDERIARLSAFVVTELFNSLPAIERESMTEQLQAMRDYSKHLHDRISRF